MEAEEKARHKARRKEKEKDALGRRFADQFGAKWLGKTGTLAKLEEITMSVTKHHIKDDNMTARDKNKINHTSERGGVYYPLEGYGKERSDGAPAVRSLKAYPFKRTTGGRGDWWKRRRRDKDYDSQVARLDGRRRALHGPHSTKMSPEKAKANPLAKIALEHKLEETSSSEDERGLASPGGLDTWAGMHTEDASSPKNRRNSALDVLASARDYSTATHVASATKVATDMLENRRGSHASSGSDGAVFEVLDKKRRRLHQQLQIVKFVVEYDEKTVKPKTTC